MDKFYSKKIIDNFSLIYSQFFFVAFIIIKVGFYVHKQKFIFFKHKNQLDDDNLF